jgi:long-chain acyl-CoA synthetase
LSFAQKTPCNLIEEKENGKLVALVYLDQDYLDTRNITLSQEEIKNQIKTQANQVLSSYEQLSAIYLQEEEFEKTPKRSIKRYIYMGK